MTPLRQRMLEDMQMRNLSRGTQMIYVRAVMHGIGHRSACYRGSGRPVPGL
jgi:hypothetical protein